MAELLKPCKGTENLPQTQIFQSQYLPPNHGSIGIQLRGIGIPMRGTTRYCAVAEFTGLAIAQFGFEDKENVAKTQFLYNDRN